MANYPTPSSKQFLLVLETSLQMQAHFADISNNYLSPLLGHLVETSLQHNVDMALVLFRGYPPHSEYLVRCSHFTRDFKEFRSWLNGVRFGPGDVLSCGPPIAEALCAAQRLSEAFEGSENCGEKHVFLVCCGSPPTTLSCRSCNLLGDALQHAARLPKSNFLLSLLAPQPSEHLQRLFDAAKPEDRDDVAINTKVGEPFALLRGLSLVSPTNPSPGVPSPIPDVQEIKAEVPSSRVPLWEGILTWQQSAQSTQPAPFCELAAYPSSLRPEADMSAFAASEWPQTLTVSGVCNSKEPLITQHFKNAKVVEFVPVSRQQPNKSETQYKHFFGQLMQKSWAAVAYLQNKTLLILPHSASPDAAKKLIGLLIPKITLTPRNNIAMSGNPAYAPTAATEVKSKSTGPPPSAGVPKQVPTGHFTTSPSLPTTAAKPSTFVTPNYPPGQTTVAYPPAMGTSISIPANPGMQQSYRSTFMPNANNPNYSTLLHQIQQQNTTRGMGNNSFVQPPHPSLDKQN